MSVDHLKDHTIPFSQYKTPPLPGATDLFIADVLKIAEERCLYLEAETEKMKRNGSKISSTKVEHEYVLRIHVKHTKAHPLKNLVAISQLGHFF